MDEAPHDQAPQVGATIGGKYRLERFLGAGGMGAVYEAVDPDGRRLALKVLRQSALTAGDKNIVNGSSVKPTSPARSTARQRALAVRKGRMENFFEPYRR